MSSTRQQFPDSEFPTIYCTKLVVNPSTTSLKWNSSRKHPGVTVLGAIDIAKCLISSEERGIVAARGFKIGTSVIQWYYISNDPGVMHVGMVDSTHDMKSVSGASIDIIITTSISDRIRFALSEACTLTIRHESLNGVIKSIEVIDISEHTGKTLYPWVSSMPDEAFTVKIFESTKEFTIGVQTNGKVVMTTSNNSIVDLNIGDIAENSGIIGGVAIASDKIQNTEGVAIECNADGGIVHSGGIRHERKLILPTTNIDVGLDQYIIVVDDPTTTSVTLPQVSTVAECMEYTISRSYVSQIGETWRNPNLKVYSSTPDTIDGETWIGLPPDVCLTVISVGNNYWRIK